MGLKFMRKLCFALAFSFIGLFAFANNIDSNIDDIKLNKESSQNVFHSTEKQNNKEQNTDGDNDDCVPVNFCGTKGFLCGAQSLEQLFDWFWYYEDLFCN